MSAPAALAWRSLATPLGTLTLAASGEGLRAVLFDEAPPDGATDNDATSVAHLDRAAAALAAYLAGQGTDLDVAIDPAALPSGFAGRVLAATAAIPRGQTSSYRAVAEAAGSPHAARAAGQALGANPLAIVVPCHRVLATDGGLGGYSGGLGRKRALLALEGVTR